MTKTYTWNALPWKHGWAFFYFLKRNKERVTATKNRNGTINIVVREDE